MQLTERFHEAYRFAAEVHAGQERKGKGVPYLAHLLGVTSIVLEDGGSETEGIAALLHDAAEDHGGRAMLARIEERFGADVARIVESCSDTLESPKPPWRERKAAYLAHLEEPGAESSLRVGLADKIYNAREILVDYRELGDALWDRFRAKTAGDHLWYYGTLVEIFNRRRPGRLAAELERTVAELRRLVTASETLASPLTPSAEERSSMGERTEFTPGTPSWVDLASPDTDASARFYGELLGWTATEPGPVEETGGYRMFELDGKPVAGLGPVQGEGQPSSWTTYVTTADAGATVARVKDAGGTVMMEPFDVLTAGRMAVFADSVGAVISVWEPREHIGAHVVNDPGSLCWNELASREIDKPKAFYRAVFGWDADTRAFGGTTYTTWRLDGRSVGGMIEMNENWPAELPPHWMVYFAVDDADAAVAKAKAAGGTVSSPPKDIATGRFAVLGDPQGAFFSVMQLKQVDP